MYIIRMGGYKASWKLLCVDESANILSINFVLHRFIKLLDVASHAHHSRTDVAEVTKSECQESSRY